MSSYTAAGKRPGWLTFAAIIMFAFGTSRIISGISYLADSNKVADLTQGLFGDDVFWWGIWDLAIAALAITAGFSLLQGHMYGRIVTYFAAGVAFVEGFIILFYAPWVGAATLTVASLVVYGLTKSEDWEASD
jgi:hypothetical protein